jgi:L-2-aminoadipate N-acetyltransferase (EC 2.3.1.-)
VILGVSYDLLRWEERNLIDEARKEGHKIVPVFTKDMGLRHGGGPGTTRG